MQLDVVARACGPCRECCISLGVAEIPKSINAPCPHLADCGCGIHGRHPESCRTWKCAWLAGMLPERYRPDLCGVVISINADNGISAQMREDATIERVKYLVGKLPAHLHGGRLDITPRGVKPPDDRFWGGTTFKRIGPNVGLAVALQRMDPTTLKILA